MKIPKSHEKINLKRRVTIENQYMENNHFIENENCNRNCIRKKNTGMNWKLMYANIQGLKSKLVCLKDTLSEVKPDIVLLTETLLSENKGTKVDGYAFFGKTREKGNGGGVGILVKNDKKVIVAPHYSNKNLEILWTSINRNSANPMYIGVYYGKQETTANKEEIKEEMNCLAEEIMEVSREGEIILCMDANAKIGLMGEDVSRNGKLILNVFDECGLQVLNGTEKCAGTITRQNRKHSEERSAIDFVVTTYRASQCIKGMKIDEEGDVRMRGKKESDHNTIIVDLKIECSRNVVEKQTAWNTKASDEKFKQFRIYLAQSKAKAIEIMSKTEMDIDVRYKKWEKIIYKAAIKSVGKTTFKQKSLPKASKEIRTLRAQRKQMKVAFQSEKIPKTKGLKMKQYIHKQQEIKEKLLEEENARIKKRFEKMISEPNKSGIWRERRLLNKDEMSNWLITKNEDGKRILDPELNKENIAVYYEGLYKKQPVTYHPYHDDVEQEIKELNKLPNDNNELAKTPTKSEIKRAIQNKKNRKATTDWKNEIIKGGGDEMVDLILPVIQAFWKTERPPKQWNDGRITSVWKGKGDRERMENQRGITVSSAIGTIAEEIIYNRMVKTIEFTQAQAGGQKGASTTDHVFILKNIMAIAKKEGREIIFTFFDVKKAYDRADTDDMMGIVGRNNFRGKIWKLMRSLNVDLTARIKTKAGITREITRETGGKQGGKLMVQLFSKLMDTLAEDMLENAEMGVLLDDTRIPSLLFVDDVISLAEGYDQQEKTLLEVHEFSLKHKLEWGQQKCKVMEIGNHKEMKNEWKLGDLAITNCRTYTYLGEVISRDGKNEENLNARYEKVKNAVRSIITCGRSEIMTRVGSSLLLQLHESIIIPTMLYNAETWVLNKTERKEVDKMDIWALKKMFNLPITTPTAAIIVTLGKLFASIRIEVKQLLYLQKVLKKKNTHWARKTLEITHEHNIGWAKHIYEILEKWELEKDWEKIAEKTFNTWKNEVKSASEKRNIEKLNDECTTKSRGATKIKTKTKTLESILNNPSYIRKPDNFITKYDRILYTRTLIIARYGMLQCGANYERMHGGKNCKECGILDNEDHRINFCEKWEKTNLFKNNSKVEFKRVYSGDTEECLEIIKLINSIWDLENGKNEMRSEGHVSSIFSYDN